MKKKFLLTPVALVCALCCAFDLAACGGSGGSGDNNVTTEVKDEAQWKQAIADASESNDTSLFVSIRGEDGGTLATVNVEVCGNIQHLNAYWYKAEIYNYERLEYYRDSEYIYANVSNENRGYDWLKLNIQNYDKEMYGENYDPTIYIDAAYSGELANRFGINVTFDGLDKLSERYADAVYGPVDDPDINGDAYTITDGDTTYYLKFELKPDNTGLVLKICYPNFELYHEMGDYAGQLSVPTESVQEPNNTNNQ